MTTPAHISRPPVAEGFFWCRRCKGVVEVSAREVDLALSAPIGALRDLKCPGCHHYEVRWKVPMRERARTNDGRLIKPPKPAVDEAQGRELWAELHRQLGF